VFCVTFVFYRVDLYGSSASDIGIIMCDSMVVE